MKTETIKCAEIFRNADNNAYSFICYHCGDEHESSDSIINHIETHLRKTPMDEDGSTSTETAVYGKYTETIPFYSMEIELKEEEPFQDDLDPNLVSSVNTSSNHNPFQMADEEMLDASSCSTQQSLFTCDFCGLSYRRKNWFKNHLRVHKTTEKSHVLTEKCCSHCDTYFATKKGLDRHTKLHQKFNQATCHYCGVVFPQGCLFTLHFSTDHINQETSTCLICNVNYEEKQKLNHHMRSKHMNLEFDQCSAKFRLATHLEHHQLTHVSPKLYGCQRCTDTFGTDELLTEHMKKHDEDEDDVVQKRSATAAPYRCHLCSSSFARQATLEYHLDKNKKYNPSKLTCDNCDANFEHGCQYVCHFGSKHTDRTLIKCLICDRQFERLKRLTIHMQRTHMTVRFECNICDGTFRSLCNLKNHHVTHTGERPFTCSICGKSFPLKTSLTRHMRFHFDEKPYQCTVCGKTFSTSGNLAEHMKRHHGAGPVRRKRPRSPKPRAFRCNLCGSTFARQVTLDFHSGKNELYNPSKLTCDNCDANFEHGCQYVCHFSRKHTDRTLIKCLICDRQFEKLKPLSIHMQTHMTVRFECKKCNGTYRSRDNLMKHQLTHTGERPFTCSVCGKSFPLKNTLKLHLRFHFNEKPYQCTVCEKSFHATGLLTEHMKNHTKVRPHKCSQCWRSFMTTKTLLAHEERHKNSAVACSVCHKLFQSKRYCSQHMKLHSRTTKK